MSILVKKLVKKKSDERKSLLVQTKILALCSKMKTKLYYLKNVFKLVRKHIHRELANLIKKLICGFFPKFLNIHIYIYL